MRIIGGRYRRRQLAGPKGPGLRPTSDRLRETLFNVLGDGVEGVRVLDAFAGTGALGLEALSRGASEVVFAERDRRAFDLVGENVRRLGVESSCRVLRGGFPAAARSAGPFDLILLDPPYDEPSLDDVVRAAADLISPGGLVVLEHSSRRDGPEAAGALGRVRVLVAGDSALSFYRPAAASPRVDHA